MSVRNHFGALALLCALALTGSATRADTPAPAATETQEKQFEQLRSAVIEAMRTRDWKMLELAAKGFKAAGLKGRELEFEILRAERDVALGSGSVNMGMNGGLTRSQVISWGLSCQAMAGDASALEILRKAGRVNPETVNPPDVKLYQANPNAYKTALQAFTQNHAQLEDRNQALFCLALMKQPEVFPRAMECLLTRIEKEKIGTIQAGSSSINTLAQTALIADPKNAWKQMLQMLSKDDPEGYDARVTLLQSLFFLSGDHLKKNGFSVDADIGALLPDNAKAQLAGSMIQMIKSWNPKQAGMDMSLHTLINMIGLIPTELKTMEFTEAMGDLKQKAAKYPNYQFLAHMLDHFKTKTIPTPDPKPEKPIKPDDF